MVLDEEEEEAEREVDRSLFVIHCIVGLAMSSYMYRHSWPTTTIVT